LLSEDEIVYEWAKQISELTGFENKVSAPEQNEISV
jgi:hypothetical protein